ncbi:hypothetical protein AA11825_2093 [Acetobacter pomorum DSM 11825]|nr:hypothetical protein AA11825_2093 [Acetobacter pomorum DSM 11825]
MLRCCPVVLTCQIGEQKGEKAWKQICFCCAYILILHAKGQCQTAWGRRNRCSWMHKGKQFQQIQPRRRLPRG